MTWPLRILAIGAVLIGYVGMPRVGAWDKNWFGHFLAPVLEPVQKAGHHAEEHHLSVLKELGLMGLSVAVAGAGIYLAWRFYGGTQALTAGQRFAARFPAVHRVLLNKYYVDEFYDAMVVGPLSRTANICWKWIDTRIVEGLVHAGPIMARLVGDFGRLTTTGNVRHYAYYFLAGILLLVYWALV